MMPSGGSKDTVEFARKHQKPVLHLWRNGAAPCSEQKLLHFVRDHQIAVLNVAGPRASQEPEIATFVVKVLDGAFGPVQRLPNPGTPAGNKARRL